MLRSIILLCLVQASVSKIYLRPPSYRGYDLNCTVCQGINGDPCDATPEKLPHTVPCRGSCVVWRTLYTVGRAMRTIYRGCEDTVFPALLPDKAKGECVYDNFFAQCTTLCEGHHCNRVGTGMPPCWDCQAEYRSCDVAPESHCTDLEITTIAPFIRKIDCVDCVGEEGGQCDISPNTIPHVVNCIDMCITVRTLFAKNRTVSSIRRGCKASEYPGKLRPEALDSCDYSDTDIIKCSVPCNQPLCNKYGSGISTACWTDKANIKDQCLQSKQQSDNPFLNTRRKRLEFLDKTPEYTDRNGTNSSHPADWPFRNRVQPAKWADSATTSMTAVSLSIQILCALQLFVIM